MGKQTFNPDGLPRPKDSYFQVIVAESDGVVGITGQNASDGQGGLVGVESVGESVEDII